MRLLAFCTHIMHIITATAAMPHNADIPLNKAPLIAVIKYEVINAYFIGLIHATISPMSNATPPNSIHEINENDSNAGNASLGSRSAAHDDTAATAKA